ncbi:sodium- and chloride-dependent betaine transporter-like [Aulostomus maculatus]
MTEETARGGPESDPSKGAPEEGAPARGKWANKTESRLSMIAGVIGLGNFWRFPFLCYKNGGGVFLFPYFVLLLFLGMPLFFLETALGQYTSEGTVTAWRKICPMFEGLGVGSFVIMIYMNIYYMVMMAWVIFYLFNSFLSPLPWSTCDNWWNTALCNSHFGDSYAIHNHTSLSLLNITLPDYAENFTDIDELQSVWMLKSSQEEFWIHRVLRISDDMSLKWVHWDLALCLLLAWVICYFCVWKGIRSTGKVVYVTATLPYLMLFIFFIRGVTLPGAGMGLGYYLIPDLRKLTYLSVWHDAAVHVIYTYIVSQGVLTALGSRNKYNNNCYRDCIGLCILSSATDIFAGCVVFSVLGYMAHTQGISVENVAGSGIGLVFQVYPKALSLLPGSSFWAVLFFLMVLLLGGDNQIVTVDCMVTAITDMFPHLRRPYARELLVLAITVVCFLLGLLFVTEGGIVLFNLVDYYGLNGITHLLIACCETVVIAWVYGADRFYDNIEDMIGYKPNPVLKYCWLFITPILCGFAILFEMSNVYVVSVYGFSSGIWGVIVGSLLLITPLICVPIFILVAMWKNPHMASPSRDLRQARPQKPLLTLCKCVIFKAQVQPNNTEGRNEKMMMEEPGGV